MKLSESKCSWFEYHKDIQDWLQLRFDCDSTALRPFDDLRYDLLWAAALRPEQAVREAATICPVPRDLDLWPFDLESGVRVTCDVGYPCANFSLPRPLCSRLRSDVRDRQTSDVRQHHRFMPPPIGGGGIVNVDRSAWLRLARYVTVTFFCFSDKQSNVRRIES